MNGMKIEGRKGKKWIVDVIGIGCVLLLAMMVLLFYGVVRNFLGGTVGKRIASIILTIFYFFGYPAISVLWGNYDYWNGNAILVLIFLLLMEIVERRWGERVLIVGKIILYFGIRHAQMS